MATLQGEVWYRERIILPDNVRLEVYLEDVSKMDVAATVIASQQYDRPGTAPWSFELEYDRNQINAKGRYAIRARVMEEQRLRFINTQRIEAFPTNGGPVKVLVQQVAAPARPSQQADNENNENSQIQLKDPSDLSMLPLTSSQWMLEQIKGKKSEIKVSENQHHLSVDDKEKRIAGNSGCNLFNGSYQLKDDNITIGPLMSTRMACQQDIMQAEQDYLQALQNARFYQLNDTHLILLDQQRKVLLKFKQHSDAE